ncbi:N-acylneuraminate cytidylyltransferase [Lates japonicus]|uniref:N-acylneuraminate cytidylyltransferase n=1 Tax=Lates japonicus TaxID=270547 RepID=A0AAD3N3H8_LATJO|nr:N-acylneuraminate cytidylyltransferase [Lates japonicus]
MGITDHDEIEKVAACGAKVHRRGPEVSRDWSCRWKPFKSLHELWYTIGECDMQHSGHIPMSTPETREGSPEMITLQGFDFGLLCGQTPFPQREVKQGVSSRSTDKPSLGNDPLRLNSLNLHRHLKSPSTWTRPTGQDVKDWGEEAYRCSFYFTTRDLVLNKGLLQGGKVGYYEMLPKYSVDIDVDIDWPVAEQRVLRYGYFGRVTPEVVRLMFCNISGCLTEGKIFLSASGEQMVSINIRDTTGIHMLQKEDVEVILLTSNKDPVTQSLVDTLAKTTSCRIIEVGEEPLNDLRPIVEQKKLEWKDVAYMGNDKQDVNCLNLAGLSAVPGDAPVVAINAAKYTCHKVAGMGAVREFAEHILLQKEKAKSQMKQDHDCSN